MPKGQYNRAASRWVPPTTVVYDPDLVAKVRSEYESGKTMAEVAESVGVTVKILQRLMPRHGIERRTAAKRNQRGAANHMWRGDNARYAALHLRVQTARGKPSYCAACDIVNEGAYEWANVSGNYDDVNDYVRLCVPCHRRIDGRRRAELGRSLSGHVRARGDVDV